MDGTQMQRLVPLLTPQEAADLLGVSRYTVMRWWRQGRLPGVRLSPRVVRFEQQDVERMMRRQQDAAE